MKQLIYLVSTIFLFLLILGNAFTLDTTGDHPNMKSGIKFVWLEDEHTFTIFLDQPRPISKHQLSVVDDLGESFRDFSFFQNEDRITIVVERELSFLRNYRVAVERDSRFAYLSKKLLDEKFHYTGSLGPEYSHGVAKISVWSPPATKIELLLYDKDDKNRLIYVKEMKREEHGVFRTVVTPDEIRTDDLDGFYYLLRVTAYGKTRLGTDPYAKSLAAFSPSEDFSKAAIVNLSKTNPSDFKESRKRNSDLLASRSQYIGYEMHIRDFTIDPSLNIDPLYRGTYLGVIDRVPYIESLGVTHVQLLPIQSFFTVFEEDRTFQGSDIPAHAVNYNWGYDAHHYFAPEGWYSSEPNDPSYRIFEFKSLVKAFHDKKIGVIMDVVYNHIYDKRIFEGVAPGCYLRMNKYGEISGGTGAGDSLETRSFMVRRLIIDSLKYFQEEFHVNGFRFDLMGFIDHETMIEIRKALGPDAVLYGEAWEFTDLPLNQATTKSNLPDGTEIGAFSDTSRDAYAGSMQGRGFVQSAFYEGPKVRAAIIGNIKDYNSDYNGDGRPDAFISTDSYQRFAASPLQTINYLTIHDGFTLWDKLNLSVRASELERNQLVRLAFSILLTSQGRVVIHGGDEVARSKPLSPNDPEPLRAHTSHDVTPEFGITHFHENSYKSPDVTNMMNWKRAEKFNEIKDFVAGLIAIRKKFSSFRYETSSQISKGLRFIAEDMPDSKRYDVAFASTFNSWSEVQSLRIQFKHGPANERYYLAGEVLAGPDKNPLKNPFYVDFDDQGFGEIFFTSDQIRNFDLRAWSTTEVLQFKLVKEPGSWESPASAYSALGHNSVKLSSIRFGNLAAIDLGIIDHVAGEGSVKHHGYIAYQLKNFLPSKDEPYQSFIVIHNAEDHATSIDLSDHLCGYEVDILVDGKKAQLTHIENSAVQIQNSKVVVPMKSTAVIGCR